MPPRGVNLIALLTRFHTTCCSRSGSPSTSIASSPARSPVFTPRASAVGCKPSTTLAASVRTSTSLIRSRTLPEMIRETSSRSSMSRACAWALRSMVSSPSRNSCGFSGPSRSRLVQPTMALSGVRSSCETTSRNSSFSLLACAASRCADRSEASSTSTRSRDARSTAASFSLSPKCRRVRKNRPISAPAITRWVKSVTALVKASRSSADVSNPVNVVSSSASSCAASWRMLSINSLPGPRRNISAVSSRLCSRRAAMAASRAVILCRPSASIRSRSAAKRVSVVTSDFIRRSARAIAARAARYGSRYLSSPVRKKPRVPVSAST